MWISYSDSEVNRFHPVCEKALNLALLLLEKIAVSSFTSSIYRLARDGLRYTKHHYRKISLCC